MQRAASPVPGAAEALCRQSPFMPMQPPLRHHPPSVTLIELYGIVLFNGSGSQCKVSVRRVGEIASADLSKIVGSARRFRPHRSSAAIVSMSVVDPLCLVKTE